MLLGSGKIFAALPFVGARMPPGFSVGPLYPWVLSRNLGLNPSGGKGLKWWRKVVVYDISVDYTCDVYALTAGGAMARNGVHGDERDPLLASAYAWEGGGDNGTMQTEAELELMPPAPYTPALGAVTGDKRFYLSETEIAPLFVLQAVIQDTVLTSRNVRIKSYPFTGGSVATQIAGGGTMDGEVFDIYVEPEAGTAVVDAAVVITPTLFYEHGGTWDPLTGLYAAGVGTNRF